MFLVLQSIPRKKRPRAFWKKARTSGKRNLHPEEQSSAAKGRRRRRREGARDCSSDSQEGDLAESVLELGSIVIQRFEYFVLCFGALVLWVGAVVLCCLSRSAQGLVNLLNSQVVFGGRVKELLVAEELWNDHKKLFFFPFSSAVTCTNHPPEVDQRGFVAEGHSINRPPFFDGTDYPYWKNRMMVFLRAQNYEVWRIVEKGPIEVTRDEDQWTREQIKRVTLNYSTMNMLQCAIHPKEYSRISMCKSANEMWDKLELLYEGTSQVRETKANMLVSDYELFIMKSNETISEMFARCNKSGHMKADCPEGKKEKHINHKKEFHKKKKKAMVATWSDDESSDYNEESSTLDENEVCFMVGSSEEHVDISFELFTIEDWQEAY
ncbi:hypothetical protein Taro_029688, partial [Colocasia esculenta]|nr:hypothetical protein [Colocasia esculenta]